MDPLDGVAVSSRFRSRFEARRELGRGAWGLVLECFDREAGRPVAVKLLLGAIQAPDARARAEVVRRLRREYQVLSGLRHPGIVEVYELGVDGELPFLVEELLAGEPLDVALEAGAPFEPRRAARLGVQVAEALHAAHERGLVHRDVKPANLFLLPDDRIKLLDFGLAKADTDATALTATGVLLGTPLYMSPEQLTGSAAGPASDLYALGIVLFRLVSGRMPHDVKSAADLYLRALHPAPPLARSAPAGTPAALCAAVDACLARKPSDRPADARTLAGLLTRAAAGDAAPPPPAAARSAARGPAAPVARRRLALAGGLGAALLLVALGWVARRALDPGPPAPPPLAVAALEVVGRTASTLQVSVRASREALAEVAFFEGASEQALTSHRGGAGRSWSWRAERLPAGRPYRVRAAVSVGGVTATAVVTAWTAPPDVRVLAPNLVAGLVPSARPRKLKPGAVFCDAVQEGGRAAVALSGFGVVCFDLATGARCWTAEHAGPVQALGAAGPVIACVEDRRAACAHFWTDGREAWRRVYAHELAERLATDDDGVLLRLVDRGLLMLEPATGAERWRADVSLVAPPCGFGPGGLVLASTRKLGFLALDRALGRPAAPVRIAELSQATSNFLAVGAELWVGLNTEVVVGGSPHAPPRVRLPLEGEVCSLVGDGRLLFAASDDRSWLAALDPRRGEVVWRRPLAAPPRPGHLLARRGRVYVDVADGGLHAFDAEDGRPLWSLAGPSSKYGGLLARPDGVAFLRADLALVAVADD